MEPIALTSNPELPDPLVMLSGQRVATREDWFARRRPELKELFQYYMYGYAPAAPTRIESTVEFVEPDYFGGLATLKEVTIRFGTGAATWHGHLAHASQGHPAPGSSSPSSSVALDSKAAGGKEDEQEEEEEEEETHGQDAHATHGRDGHATTDSIRLLLAIPNRRTAPAPAFVGLNFCGNHAADACPKIALPQGWIPKWCPACVDNRACEAGRGAQAGDWPLERIVARGYAVATFYAGDIDPDRNDFTDGIHPHHYRPGQLAPGPHDWGTIAAWAWGLSRAVDYLLTDAAIDGRRIASFGHSRLGKTALLAGAFDDRIAAVFPHQAGCGGTAPSRGKAGESVRQINDAFPHWFCGQFKAFNDRPDLLPFDQHCLAALVAPRPLLLSNATEDAWANPPGQFQVLQGADPVYRLLGASGLEAGQVPPIGKLLDSRLGFFIREGKHSTTPADWDVFMAFADKWMKP
jgi:hypothetical protein